LVAKWKDFLVKKNRKKMGRPKLPKMEQRSIRHFIGLRRDEVNTLDSIAASSGQSFSTWARNKLLAAAQLTD